MNRMTSIVLNKTYFCTISKIPELTHKSGATAICCWKLIRICEFKIASYMTLDNRVCYSISNILFTFGYINVNFLPVSIW